MQPIIEAYPNTPIVLLHSSYPYTREAGYLASVYENVYLDFGEVFPFLSGQGQRTVIQQVLELAPTNKILWSSTLAPCTCTRSDAHALIYCSRRTLVARVLLSSNHPGAPGTLRGLRSPSKVLCLLTCHSGSLGFCAPRRAHGRASRRDCRERSLPQCEQIVQSGSRA